MKNRITSSINSYLFYSLIIIIITIIAYFSSIQGGFVWDDDCHVTENPTLGSLKGLAEIWRAPQQNFQYYPITMTVFWIQDKLWGSNPLGYHLVNVLIHIINALLLFSILNILKIKSSFFAALIFAIHPVHVESVAWVTELKNVLSGMFYLISFIFFLKYFEFSSDLRKKSKFKMYSYVLSFLLFICALLSKTVTCTFPAAVLVTIYWKKKRIKLKEIINLLPFFIFGLLFGFLTAWLDTRHFGAGSKWNFTLIERFLIAGRAFWFYPLKLIWPRNLIFFYPKWKINAYDLTQYVFLFAAFIFVSLLWKYRNKISNGPFTAIMFYFVTIFPALGFFDYYTMTYTLAADHYQYLASIGLIVLFTHTVDFILNKIAPNKIISISLYSVIVAVLSLLTLNQGRIYKDSITLYRYIIKKNPSCWMAYNNMGIEYRKKGDHKKAIESFSNAILVNPKHYKVYNNRGNVYKYLKKYDLALKDFNKSLLINSKAVEPYLNRANIYHKKGFYKKELQDLNKAISLKPDYYVCYYNRGNYYKSIEKPELAIRDYTIALENKPDYVNARNNRGNSYREIKKYDLAINDFNYIIGIAPNNAVAYYNRALVYKAKGDSGAYKKDLAKAKSFGLIVSNTKF